MKGGAISSFMSITSCRLIRGPIWTFWLDVVVPQCRVKHINKEEREYHVE